MCAGILSVVDCFDAVTSDRPYRQRLSSNEALKILLERRGSMYDPLIVDTFLRRHHEIAPETSQAGPPSNALNEITSATQHAVLAAGSSRLEDIAASAEEMLILYELARALTGQVSISDIGDIVAKQLKRLIPSSVVVFYLYDASMDELEAKHVTGDAASIVRGLKIPRGQRLSGWCREPPNNRQCRSHIGSGRYRSHHDSASGSSLSTPLLSDEQLVGVLTLCSHDRELQ